MRCNFKQMLDCGIPQLDSTRGLQYVYDSLTPNTTDDEATAMFTKFVIILLFFNLKVCLLLPYI